jgi:hypothetical protein
VLKLHRARNDGASNGCVGLRHHRQPAGARRRSVAMRNRAFRVTPARFLLGAAVRPVDADQFDPEI